MQAFISDTQAARLRRVVRRYRAGVKLRQPWNKLSDDELWRKVLGQVVVIGRAEPGDRLHHNSKTKIKVSVKRLSRFQTDAELQKYLHELFVELKVRYVGSNWKKDWKAKASVRNFRILMAAGGPKHFFQKRIASCKTEEKRIDALRGTLKGYGNKSARDTLIELRLAENCMALDARIFGVLKKVRVKVSPDDIYKQIEKELREKVAEPLGIQAALLDRILFRKYADILKQL
jgi:hypothetical protein